MFYARRAAGSTWHIYASDNPRSGLCNRAPSDDLVMSDARPRQNLCKACERRMYARQRGEVCPRCGSERIAFYRSGKREQGRCDDCRARWMMP